MSIPKISDVKVIIDVEHPQTTVGLSNPAFFVPSETAGYKEYLSLDDIVADYSELSPVYKYAEAVFEQDNAPQLVAVISYLKGDVEDDTAKLNIPTNVKATVKDGSVVVTADAPKPTMIKGIVQAAQDYWYNNWEFALMPTFDLEDALALSKLVDDEAFHMFLPQVTEFEDGKKFAEFKRTWPVIETNENNQIAAAMVGAGGAMTVGSLNWSTLNSLNGITTVTYTNAREVAKYKKAGIVCYTAKNNTPAVSKVKNASGNFIDWSHGDDWIKSNVENNLQAMILSNHKISYDAQGIALIKNSCTSTLNTAFNQGIIDSDIATGKGAFNVSTKPMSSVPTTDVIKRIYNGLSFDWKRSNAVDELTVHGTVKELV